MIRAVHRNTWYHKSKNTSTGTVTTSIIPSSPATLLTGKDTAEANPVATNKTHLIRYVSHWNADESIATKSVVYYDAKIHGSCSDVGHTNSEDVMALTTHTDRIGTESHKAKSKEG